MHLDSYSRQTSIRDDVIQWSRSGSHIIRIYTTKERWRLLVISKSRRFSCFPSTDRHENGKLSRIGRLLANAGSEELTFLWLIKSVRNDSTKQNDSILISSEEVLPLHPEPIFFIILLHIDLTTRNSSNYIFRSHGPYDVQNIHTHMKKTHWTLVRPVAARPLQITNITEKNHNISSNRWWEWNVDSVALP